MKKTFTKTTILTGFPMALLCCLLIFGWTNATAQSGIPFPSNDECANATVLTPGSTCATIGGSLTGATQSADTDFCDGTPNDDVWYSFTAVAAEATITVTPTDPSTASPNLDLVVDVLSGTCGALTSEWGCEDVTARGAAETITMTDLVIGNVYYVRVYHFYAAVSSPSGFDICLVSIAPCDNSASGQYPIDTYVIAGAGAVETIVADAIIGEYSQLSGVQNLHSYEFTHSGPAFITVRSGTSDGPVVGSGDSPLTVTATSTDNLFAHYTVDAGCAEGPFDPVYTTTVQDLTPGLCTSTSNNYTFCYEISTTTGFVINPNNPGDLPSIFVNSGSVEAGWDEFNVYDGTSNADPLLVALDGDLTGTLVTSTSGNLYLEIIGDNTNSCGSGDETSLDYDVFCGFVVVDGCTDPTAINYNPAANNDDGSCILPTCQSPAQNYTYCYDNNETTQFLYVPVGPGSFPVIYINAGSFEVGWDDITIYDGNTTAAPQLLATTDGDVSGTTVVSTSGFLLIEITSDGSGSCADLDETTLDYDVYCGLPCFASDAGTITADADPVCLVAGGTATITATPDGNQLVPTDYEQGYVLTLGGVLVQTSATASFDVTAGGDYTIHTIVYNPDELTPAVAIGAPAAAVNGLLIQGGGTICATLDLTGATITVNDPDAGTITADAAPCYDGVDVTITATPDANQFVPTGYETGYALTEAGVVTQVGATASFDVSATGDYTIHTFVYPTGFPVGTAVGQTGAAVNALLVQGGGAACAALDLTGATITVAACPPPAPANDLCDDAETLACGVATTGTTVGASATGSPSTCDAFATDLGVWYTFTGTGGDVKVSTCGATTAGSVQQPWFAVYSGPTCAQLTCVEGAVFSTPDPDCGTAASVYVDFTSDAGVTYYVFVTASSGSGTVDFDLTLTCDPTVGITENGIEEINVYPNPSNGQFVVEVNGVDADAQITVMDVAGREVYTEGVNMNGNFRKELNLDVAKGTYLLQIATVEGMVTRKIQIN